MSCQGKGFSLDLYTLVQNLTALPAGRSEYSISCLQFLIWHRQNNPLSCGQPKFCLSCNVSHLVHNYHVVRLPSTVQTPSLCWGNLQSYGSHFIRIQKAQVPDSFATRIQTCGLDLANQSSLVCKQAICGDKLGGTHVGGLGGSKGFQQSGAASRSAPWVFSGEQQQLQFPRQAGSDSWIRMVPVGLDSTPQFCELLNILIIKSSSG